MSVSIDIYIKSLWNAGSYSVLEWIKLSWRCNNTQHYNFQENDVQDNDNVRNMTFSITMLIIITFKTTTVSITIIKCYPQHNDDQHNNAFYWVLPCRMSLWWVSSCWVSWRFPWLSSSLQLCQVNSCLTLIKPERPMNQKIPWLTFRNLWQNL
jgi:hypothetical protein